MHRFADQDNVEEKEKRRKQRIKGKGKYSGRRRVEGR
jgi:hypothetical protein